MSKEGWREVLGEEMWLWVLEWETRCHPAQVPTEGDRIARILTAACEAGFRHPAVHKQQDSQGVRDT